MLAVLACLAQALGAAPPALPAPFEVRARGEGTARLRARPDLVARLAGLARVRLESFPLPDGTDLDLELVRLDVERLGFVQVVDGETAPALLSGLDLSVWTGTVAGRPDERAALAFSAVGFHGWIEHAGGLAHLVSTSFDDLRLIDGAALSASGVSAPTCAAAALGEPSPALRPSSAGSTKAAGSPSLYHATVAVETDWQLNQVFAGDVLAEAVYVTSLMTWVSWRYEEQIATVLTYPYVKYYTIPGDPWTTPDVPGNCIDMIYEFQAAWQGNVPAGADLAHFLSGAPLGCGAAYLGALCHPTDNFGVTGNIDGQNEFPIQVSPTNFNFYGVCHELGHNFDAIHTHEYCPPIDQCAPPGYFGPCQNQKVCTSAGTLMSYCHGCPGGFTNITTYFHPQSATDMRAHVESSCLPLYCPEPVPYCTAKPNSLSCLPAIQWQGHPTLAGIDDFFVTAEYIVSDKNGLLFHGRASTAVPFLGGTLCVAPPITRTAVQSSGGNPPPSDCSGTFAFFWSHLELAQLGAGNTIYAQYWYRDPLASYGSGLTAGLGFTICN